MPAATTRTRNAPHDDPDTRDLLGRVLSTAGYSIRFASNGWEGLLALETPVDLVLRARRDNP